MSAMDPGNLEGLQAEIERLRREYLEAMEDVERLTAALRPFADYADAKSKMPGDYVITSGSALAKRQLTMADCYAARAALEGKP